VLFTKRLFIYFLVGLATFSVGFAVVSILTANRLSVDPPKHLEVEPATLNVSEPAARLGITPPSPNLIFSYDPKEFNPRGDYYILGRKPKNLREFDCLELAVDHERASGVVMIQTYANQTYSAHYAVSGLVTNERLTFVTAPVSEDDFEYSFEGYFVRGGVLWDAGKNEAVLKGMLRKSKRGVKVAEGEIKFRVEYLGC
jgi:hypothetical protein